MAGYAFGAIVVRDPAEWRRLCLWSGLSATALFLIAAGLKHISCLRSGRPSGSPERRASLT